MSARGVTSSADLVEVLRILPRLKGEELRRLDSRVRVLMNIGPAPSRGHAVALTSRAQPDGGIDYLLEGCYAEGRRRGLLGRSGRLPERELARLAPNYIKDAEYAWETLVRGVDRLLSPAECISLSTIGVRALADHLEAVVSPGLRTLLVNIRKVPEAIDASYPDYIRSGMLGILIRVK